MVWADTTVSRLTHSYKVWLTLGYKIPTWRRWKSGEKGVYCN